MRPRRLAEEIVREVFPGWIGPSAVDSETLVTDRLYARIRDALEAQAWSSSQAAAKTAEEFGAKCRVLRGANRFDRGLVTGAKAAAENIAKAIRLRWMRS